MFTGLFKWSISKDGADRSWATADWIPYLPKLDVPDQPSRTWEILIGLRDTGSQKMCPMPRKKLCIALHLHQIWTRIPDSSGFRRLTKVVLEVIWFFFDVQPAIDGGSTPQDVRYGAPGLIRPSNQLCGGVYNFGPGVGVFGFSKVLFGQRLHMLPSGYVTGCELEIRELVLFVKKR